jgi:quercetin dioxygenase-like cupin family protein
VATVRTLLSRVFMKCGVRRQAELVKLLASIANACSMAHGIRVGLDLQRAGADSNPYRRAAVQHLHDVVTRELTQAREMEATVHMIDFAPGQTTQPHYHTHGHEVLCVLRGDLTTEFGDGPAQTTQPGQARYVPERVLHRGLNPAASGNVRVLSINVARRGSAFRVEQASLAPAR